MKRPVSKLLYAGLSMADVRTELCAALLAIGVFFLLPRTLYSQTRVDLTVDASVDGPVIPNDFSGLGFETKSVLHDTYGVHGYFFTPGNTQLITIFQNVGIKHIRVGGGTVDGSGMGEQCSTPIPDHNDIDNLFKFAAVAGVRVIYSLRLLNLSKCNDPDLLAKDAAIAKYIWDNYRGELDSFSIGNEPDVREYHTYPGHPMDPLIYEESVGIAGSAYSSYFSDWVHFATVVHRAVPDAKFSGPETAVSDTSSYTPSPSTGVSWTQKFATDLKGSGLLIQGLQHHYVWGSPGSTTVQEAIDDMLSSTWDDETTVGMQPARNGSTAPFHPYPYLYAHNLAPLAATGVTYRMTEANDCLHGVVGASNGYASALWALDYMHWWAAHGMAGVNFHNNPWIPTDTIVPDPNPCSPKGCASYQISPKAYGIKAFDLGSHGYVRPIKTSNPSGINLTAYAVGTARDLFVTIINKTHSTTHDVTDSVVSIQAMGFPVASAAYMVLSGGQPGNAASMNPTLGEAKIANNSRWLGRWKPVSRDEGGIVSVTVKSTTAVIVKLHAAGVNSGSIEMDQNGSLDIFVARADNHLWSRQVGPGSTRWSPFEDLNIEESSIGSVATAKNEDNTLQVFVSDVSKDVYYAKQAIPGGSWSKWARLGDERVTGLKAGNNADGSLSIFGIGPNGDLWANSQNAPEGEWSGWHDLSGRKIKPGFAIGHAPDGHLELFIVNGEGGVLQSSQMDIGTWSEWRKVDGKTQLAGVVVGGNLDGRLELFGVDTAGRVMHNSQSEPGGTWTGWTELRSKSVNADLFMGQYSDGRLVIFGTSVLRQRGDTTVLDKNTRVWSIEQEQPDGRFGDWMSVGHLGGKLLAVGNRKDGSIQLFAIDSNKRISTAYETSGPGRWSAWEKMPDNGVIH